MFSIIFIASPCAARADCDGATAAKKASKGYSKSVAVLSEMTADFPAAATKSEKTDLCASKSHL